MNLHNSRRAASHGPAPELPNTTTWINPHSRTPTHLLGDVVAYQFWTYTCVNWLRTLPYVRAWAHRYHEHGLIIVGVHTPEFAFEGDSENVREAVTNLQIDYPVVLDSDYEIWRAFDNHYWPALYLADAAGTIRYHHFGEGAYQQTEAAIQALLSEPGVARLGEYVEVSPVGVEVSADWEHLESPETYLGSARGDRFASRSPHEGVYRLADRLQLNQWALEGAWTHRRDAITLTAGTGTIRYRFHARDVNLVLASTNHEIRFRTTLDGTNPGPAHGADCDESGSGIVNQPRLYQLIRQPDQRTDHTFEKAGVEAYAFTFG